MTALSRYLCTVFKVDSLEIISNELLSGGAIQENWALDIQLPDGSLKQLVLRSDAPSSVSASLSRQQEYAALTVAFENGVMVPEPIAYCDDVDVVGKRFFLMTRLPGAAQPVHITRECAVKLNQGEQLADSLGRELAKIHAIPRDDTRLSFITKGIDEQQAILPQRLDTYVSFLNVLGIKRPVLQWSIAWLRHQNIPTDSACFCHSDFRTGNLLVENGTLSAVLDWEFVTIGDRHEDIGWFCAPCWRFAARHLEAGGIGQRETFYKAYEANSGNTINRDLIPVWEVMATLRWAIIALQQGARFISGEERSLELALTGRMIAELEKDLIELICAVEGIKLPQAPDAANNPDVLISDEPDTADLLQTARDLLLDAVLPELKGTTRYKTLMIANAMGIAARATTELDKIDRRVDKPACNPETDTLDADFIKQLYADTCRRVAIANPKHLNT